MPNPHGGGAGTAVGVGTAGSEAEARDVRLSPEGIANAKKLVRQVNAFPELVVASPFTSALQTALILFGDSPAAPRRVVPHRLLREAPKASPQSVGKPQVAECKGRLKAQLIEDAALRELGAESRVAWEELEDCQWWSDKIAPTAETQREAASFRDWLLARKEGRIAVIGHTAIFGHMVKNKPYSAWPKSTVPYFCHLITKSGTWLVRGDLMYGGTTLEAAVAVKPSEVDSKVVLLVRPGTTLLQERRLERQRAKRNFEGSSCLFNEGPPPKRVTAPLPSATEPLPGDPLFRNGAAVTVRGIATRPEMNGQTGQVVSYVGGPDRRYQVRVAGALVSLREDKLAATARSSPRLPREEIEPEDLERLPIAALTAQGQLIPSYAWARVPSVAALPPGLEVKMPLSGLRCARIPVTWRLQVVAEGRCDAYRCDVGERTPVAKVLAGAAAAFGWDVHELRLDVDGRPLVVSATATVGSAELFGRRLTAARRLP